MNGKKMKDGAKDLGGVSFHHILREFGVRWMMASIPMSALDSLCALICWSCAIYDASPDECECADCTDDVYPWCGPDGW